MAVKDLEANSSLIQNSVIDLWIGGEHREDKAKALIRMLGIEI